MKKEKLLEAWEEFVKDWEDNLIKEINKIIKPYKIHLNNAKAGGENGNKEQI